LSDNWLRSRPEEADGCFRFPLPLKGIGDGKRETGLVATG
jgi:hypothetical protein